MTVSKHTKKTLWIVAGFLFCVLVAYSVRTSRYNNEKNNLTSALGYDFVPFTIESAIMYSYAHDVATGKGIPEYDQKLVGMENYKVSEQISLGMEYFLGWGYRLKNLFWDSRENGKKMRSPYEDDPDFTNWLRFQIRLWTSWTTGFIFLWLIFMRCPWYFALFGGLVHSFSPAAIARYTGQDLVRGQFSLPLITGTFMMAYWTLTKPKRWKFLVLGLIAFLAISTWDMTQICFGLWALVELIRILAGGVGNKKRRHVWLVIFIAMVLAGILVPYHRAHHLLLSPTVLILLPTVIVCYSLPHSYSLKKRWAMLALSFVAFVVIWKIAVAVGDFGGNYGHFGELLKAKLAFWNVKPAKPDLLSFDARVLWTPSMQSATWLDAKMLFPGAGYCLLLALLVLLCMKRGRFMLRQHLGRSLFPLIMTCLYFIGFVYIYRYHVFAILFMTLSVAFLCADLARVFRSKTVTGVLIMLALIGVVLEVKMTYRLERKYLIDGYLKETCGLIKWFRQEGVENQPMLADFGLSPMLKAYCQSKILLQPKYELKQNRDNYQRFVNTVYHGTEVDMNKFCSDTKMDFFIFDRGYGPHAPLHIYSPRYFAAAYKIKRETPSHQFFFQPDKSRWFYRIEPPAAFAFTKPKYSVFRVITPEQRMDSMKLTFKGMQALQEGKRKTARKCAKMAFYLDPNSDQAYRLYATVFERVPRIHLSGYKKIKKREKHELGK
jgi:hypothetical protein